MFRFVKQGGRRRKVLFDAWDLALFESCQWHIALPGHRGSRHLRNRQMGMFHSFVLPIPPELEEFHLVVDHIDGNGLNNQSINLRWLTGDLNRFWRPGKGVTPVGNRWRANLSFRRRVVVRATCRTRWEAATLVESKRSEIMTEELEKLDQQLRSKGWNHRGFQLERVA